MWIKLLKIVEGHAVGEKLHIDSDTTGAAYIAAGLAEKTTEGDAERSVADTVMSRLAPEFDALGTALASQLRTASQAITDRKVRIEAGPTETEKRASGGNAIAEICRNLWLRSCPERDVAEAANNVLFKQFNCTRPMGENRTVGETSGAANLGVLIQPEYYQSLFEIAIEDTVMISGARNIPMGSKELFWPALDQYRVPTKGHSAAYAGVQIYRQSEEKTRTESDPLTSQIKFVAEDLTGYHEVRRDMLADSFISYEALINQVFGMAFAWRNDYEAFQGTGIGQMLGLFNPASKSTLHLNRKTASVILLEDVVAMLSMISPQFRKDLVWVGNVTTYPQLAALKDAAGNALFLSSAMAGITDAPSERLLGFPIKWTEKVASVGNTGDLSLVCRRGYGYATRSGLEVAMSDQFGFDRDVIAFRWKQRNDGKPLMKGPFTQSDGGTTTATKTSWAVCLDAHT